MEQYIPKADVVEEIERIQKTLNLDDCGGRSVLAWSECLKKFLNTLEVKEVDEQKERMSECPHRQVGCTMYEDKILECNGACGWVVDCLKLKELKA